MKTFNIDRKWNAVVLVLCVLLFSAYEPRSQNAQSSDSEFPNKSELLVELEPAAKKKHAFLVTVTNRSDKPLIYFNLSGFEVTFLLFMKSEENAKIRQMFVADIPLANLPLSSRTESSAIIERNSKMTFEVDLGSLKWMDGKSSYIGPEVIKKFSELPMGIYFGEISLRAPTYTQTKLPASQTDSFPPTYASDQVKIDLWETNN